MENITCYFQGAYDSDRYGIDDNFKYRLEYNDDNIAYIYSMEKDENGKFKDTGYVCSVTDINTHDGLDFDTDIKQKLCETMAVAYGDNKKWWEYNLNHFEMSQATVDGNVHSFVWNRSYDEEHKLDIGRLDEFENGKPVNKSVTMKAFNMSRAFDYAKQMLQIYVDEPAYSIKDEEYNVTLDVYANADNSAYNILAYHKDNTGLSIVNNDMFLGKEYKSIDDAINTANETLFPDTAFAKLVDIDFSASKEDNIDDRVAMITIIYEQDGEKHSITSEGYTFQDFRFRMGYYFDNDAFDEKLDGMILTNEEYNRRYDEAEKEFLDSLWDATYDEFISDDTYEDLFKEMEIPIKFHIADLERLQNQIFSTRIEVVPNVLLEKEKTKSKDAISRD